MTVLYPNSCYNEMCYKGTALYYICPAGIWLLSPCFIKLEDLKVLKRSSDLLNIVKIGQGQLRLIIQTYFVLLFMGSGHFDQVT